jgi:endoglucanase
MRTLLFCLLSGLGAVLTPAATNQFNYAEALQKSLYFYEAQQSGRLSPNNRVEWRGPACINDGQDIGRDLSGGWFDAGDHWTANLTMSFAAMTLAWSAVEHPEAYLRTGQMDELIENLIHVNDYFVRCVLNPECHDPATELEVVIGCGGREGVESPNVHSLWAPAEVAHLMTQRPTFRVNRSVPAGDIPAAMAAAMAPSSMVIREHAALLRERRGFKEFNAAAFADTLLDRAEKLTRFARANAGPVLSDSLPKEEQERIRKARSSALRADGKVVVTGYRADPFDKLIAAATWLQRAHLAKDPQAGSKWFDLAVEVYEHEYKSESNHDWWKDFGAGNFGKLAAFNLMRLAPTDERFHAELQLYCSRFAEYRETPGGLRLREWSAHEYGSLRHANNAAVIALYYSEHVEKAPVLSGNTWWKARRSNAELRAQYAAAARRQVDYALGANPYCRSYLVGFGSQPFNHPHHRGAYGAWAGFEHFIPGKADDRTTNRHVLYGALIAGPDHNDVFLGGKDHLKWLPLPEGKGEGFFYQFPNRPTPVAKEGYTWTAADLPFQDVMDSTFNEVALDYNAGITASFAWLTAQGFSRGDPLPDSRFPPREIRAESDDLKTTDREFFVAARRVEASPGSVELEATLNNRSRWPAQVFTNLALRIYFTLEPGFVAEQVSATLVAGRATLSKIMGSSLGRTYVEVAFPGERSFPGNLESSRRVVRLRLTAPTLDLANDWSLHRLEAEPRLLPELPVYEAGRRLAGIEPVPKPE